MTHNNTDICISVNYDLKFEEKCCETFQYLWEGSSEAGISSLYSIGTVFHADHRTKHLTASSDIHKWNMRESGRLLQTLFSGRRSDSSRLIGYTFTI